MPLTKGDFFTVPLKPNNYVAQFNDNAAWSDDRERSLNFLQKQFIEKNFPNDDNLDLPTVRIHDAAHQWVNTLPTAYGEKQQQLADLAGLHNLTEKTGAYGFGNQFPNRIYDQESFSARQDSVKQQLEKARNDLNYQSDVLSKRDVIRKRETNPNAYRGIDVEAMDKEDVSRMPLIDRKASFGSFSSLEELNNPNRTYNPGINKAESEELYKRGKQFFGQVEKNLPEGFPRVPVSLVSSSLSEDTPFANDTFIPANTPGNLINENENIIIKGGYDKPGALAYGNIMQHVSPPKQLGYDVGAYRSKVAPLLEKYAQDTAKKGTFTIEDFENFSKKYGGPSEGDFYSAHFNQIPDDQIGDYVLNKWKSRTGVDSLARLPSTPESNAILADLKDIPKVKNALQLGNRIGGSFAGNLPLNNPEFHRSLENRDYEKAAITAAKDIGTGVVGEGLTTVGAGVLQRVAPRIAGTLLPAASGVAGVLGPTALMVGAGMTADAALKGLTGRNTVQNVRRVLGTDRPVLPNLFPQPKYIPANTPTGVARIIPTRRQPSPVESVKRFAGQGYGWLDKNLFRGFLPGGAARR